MLIIYETMLNMGGSRSPYTAFSSVLGGRGGGGEAQLLIAIFLDLKCFIELQHVSQKKC